MRRTALLCQTLRESPADVELPGQRLLLRGGYVQPLAAGIYSFLPLGLRVQRKIEQILREEMEALGASTRLTCGSFDGWVWTWWAWRPTPVSWAAA